MTIFRVIFDEKTGQWAAKIAKKQHQNIIKMAIFMTFLGILHYAPGRGPNLHHKNHTKFGQNRPKRAFRRKL